MIILDHILTFPDLVNNLTVTLGIGLAGIVGAKATEEVRALTEGERRADYFDALASDIDSFRRRKELSEGPGNRDWADVGVDRFSNVVVVPEHVPEICGMEEMSEFDRLLQDAPAARRLRAEGEVEGDDASK